PYTTYERDSEKPLPPAAKQTADEAQAQSQGTPPPPPPAPSPAPNPPPQAVPQSPVAPVTPAVPVVPQAYLDAYDRVGRPRLLVLVDHAETPDKALVPGDYDVIEQVVREAVSAGGQVAVVSPAAVHEHVTEQQRRDIAAGRATALLDVG